MKKLVLLFTLLALLTGLFSGCKQPASAASVESSVSVSAETGAVSPAESDVLEEAPITHIALNGSSISIQGSGAQVDGTVITITAAGRYQFRGTLEDGQIIVDADKEDEVVLLLSGVDITCLTSAPIYVKQAKTAYIELDEGTENIITDTASYALAPGEDEPDAAIFSKDDLALCGVGSLTVNGNYNMAVHGKDTVTIAHSGTYSLTAVGDGLKGKDQVTILDGNITIHAGEDGIQGSNDKDTDSGNVCIDGGSVTITAGKHGIKAESQLVISSGDITVTTQEDGLHCTKSVRLGWHDEDVESSQTKSLKLAIDAQQDGVQAGSALLIGDGNMNITTGGGTANAPDHTEQFGFPGWFDTAPEDDTPSAKGLKSDGDLTVSGGVITLDCMDDALHCAGTLSVSDTADLTIATGDDGLHSDDTLSITGGTIQISQSYEGLEAVFIDISGGNITLTASDDGLNAAGGADADTDFPFRGPPGLDGAAETLEDASYYIHITGGTLTVDAGGDGLDSNGALFIDGGQVFVSGPSNSMNGGLDYTTTGQINGGTVVVAGASGMAQNFDTSSTQPSLMYTFSSQIEADSNVTLTTATGDVLVDTTMAKPFNNVIISLPQPVAGESYILTCGTETVDVTLTNTITSLGTGGFGMGGPGGGPGNIFPPG